MKSGEKSFYTIGKRCIVGVTYDGYVSMWVQDLTVFGDEQYRFVGKGYVTPCWWLFRRSIRTMMDKAIIQANRLHQKDQEILFGKRMVNDALVNIKLETEALKLLDEEFAS